MRAALLSPKRERWASSRDAGLRRRVKKLGWGTGHAREKGKEGVGRREREKGGKGLGCLSGFRAGSDWLVGFGFSIFLLFSNSSS